MYKKDIFVKEDSCSPHEQPTQNENKMITIQWKEV